MDLSKDQIVTQVTDANTALLFNLLSTWAPWLKIPLLSWVVKYYISKLLKPMVNEGAVLIDFKVIDWDELEKAKNFANAMEVYKIALTNGWEPQALGAASDDFDRAFSDAISLNSK